MRVVEKSANNESEQRTTQRIVDLEERNWLPRHCRGDHEAFPALLRAYRGPVYNYLVRCGVAETIRDDLFQDIFLRVHAAAASYLPTRPLRPWLFTIIANTVRNHLRGQRLRQAAYAEEDAEAPDPRPDAQGRAEAQELVNWLEQAIADLPLSQRDVLLLVTIEGLPQQEVAEILKMPLNTVKTHLRRARLTLVGALNRHNGSA